MTDFKCERPNHGDPSASYHICFSGAKLRGIVEAGRRFIEKNKRFK